MQRLLLIFKALSDETRLRILKLLEGGELCVCDIAEALIMAQPNISFHISMLKDAGLVKDRKEGRWIHYSLNLSDMYTRLLLLGIFERMNDNSVQMDMERLANLISNKDVINLCR
jgi:ArsR family transcriptional regulator